MLDLTKTIEKIDVGALDMLKQREDKPPTLFVKLTTKFGQTSLVIDTDFKKIHDKKLVTLNPLHMLGKNARSLGSLRLTTSSLDHQ